MPEDINFHIDRLSDSNRDELDLDPGRPRLLEYRPLITQFNRLSPAESERLYVLAEEAGEVVKAAMKILRHGYESVNPDDDGCGLTNRADLEKEIGDMHAAVQLLKDAGDIDGDAILNWWQLKLKKIIKYLHHQS